MTNQEHTKHPMTAERLLATYPSVNAFRSESGRIVLSPADGIHAPANPFYTFMNIRLLSRLEPRSNATLEMRSSTIGLTPDKALAVPVLGSLAALEVTREGDIPDEDILTMTRQGIGLICAYRRMPEEERDRLHQLPLPIKVLDMNPNDGPNITAETIDSYSYEEIAQGALSVARRILLEA